MPTSLDRAAYFDGWYTDMGRTPLKDQIEQRHLGLPPQLLSTSLLTWEGIAEVVSSLRLSPGDLLLDLACGRGGYGLEIASRTGARLLGLDFSPEAVRQARGQAAHLQRQPSSLSAGWRPPGWRRPRSTRRSSSTLFSSLILRRRRTASWPGWCGPVAGWR
ncbi:methyltransferase domain-containing protein [Dermatophilaceae bacterium Soc4.6]